MVEKRGIYIWFPTHFKIIVNTDKAPRQIQLFEITICLCWHGSSHHRNNYYVTNDVCDLMTIL